MRAFAYARPDTLDEAVALLDEYGTDARVLAGGTDLIIRLRDRTLTPTVVVDVKRIPEFAASITQVDGVLRFSAGTTMTDVCENAFVRSTFPALADAASIIGSVQIRNRATLVGNQCNASPAADTAPVLLVFGATLVVVSLGGERRVALDDFFVRSGVTTLQPGELVTAIEVPIPRDHEGSAFARRTRRRGHDLASVTMAASVTEAGAVRLSYGSVGPRPWVFASDGGEPPLEEWFARATPSPTSMRASPDYRSAMLRVLASRGDCRRPRKAGRGLMQISLTLNGRPRTVTVEDHHTLLDALRDDLGLTGTKECCLVGECGACTVRLNDRIVDSCLVLAVEADGGRVITVEGLAAEDWDADDGELSKLQASFLQHGAVQCGFCIPGQLMAGDDVLRRVAMPTREQIEEGIAGNLCRCGCYVQIIDAVAAVAAGHVDAAPLVVHEQPVLPHPPVDQ